MNAAPHTRLAKIERERSVRDLDEMARRWDSGDPLFGPPLTTDERQAIATKRAQLALRNMGRKA